MKNKNTVIKILGILFLGTLVACANCSSKPPKSTSGPENTQPSPTPVTDITDAMILTAGTSGCEKLAKLLQSLKDGKGGDVNELDSYGYTPLYRAVMDIAEPDNLEIVKVLLELGADPNVTTNQYGSTLLHAAAIRENRLGALKLLLAQSGIQINAQDLDGEIPLHGAVRNLNLEAVKALLAQPGINKAIQNKTHETALQVAQAELATIQKKQKKTQKAKSKENKYLDIIQLLT